MDNNGNKNPNTTVLRGGASGYEINTLYLYRPVNTKTLNVKEYKDYPYKSNGVLVSSGLKSIYRYCKDFEVNDRKFSLLLLSDSKEDRKILNFFKDNLKNIPQRLINQSPNSPQNLNIKYEAKK